MPEPRETHAAIDARRNTQRGGGGNRLARFSDVVGKDEADRLADEEREAQRRIQRRRMEDIAARSPEYARMRAERDALAETVQRVRAAHTKAYTDGRDDRRIPYCVEDSEAAQAWVSWPCPTIRALDAAASDPATDTGGEAT